MLKYLLLFLIPFFTFAQTITGTVKDSLNTALPNANVIAKPLIANKNLKFSIADHLGRYKLELEKNVPYEIKVSYLGYQEAVLNIGTESTLTEHHFILKETGKQLEEIVINYKYQPVIVKKDTLIYDVKAFANGNERKMKEVLEKMPGVEVGKDGSVTVQGKKVTKMLVEGKSFFGGGSKLAVENIPADALDKIEVIDNFNEVGFLKQVSDSDDLAMNVKLKENKKKFIFGDIEAGTEIADDNGYYLLHAGLFYFSPKTNVSYIGDSNSIGRETFTYSDLMRFQGGASSYINGRKQLSNLYQFVTENTNVVKNRSQFNAFNINQEINSKISVEGYGIFSKLFTATLTEASNEYLQNNAFTFEERTNSGENKALLGIVNLKLDYSPTKTAKWYYNLQYQSSANNNVSLLNSLRDNQLSTFETLNNADNNQIKQFLEYHKQYNNKKHTTTFVVNQSYDNNKPINTWLTDSPFLAGLIPLQSDSFYTIKQIKKIKNNSLDALLKHYLIINDFNHLYTVVGNNLGTATVDISEQQQLTNGSVNDYALNGFGNNLDYILNDFYAGLEYKFKIGNLTTKPAVYSHFYHLKTKQIAANYSLNRTFLEPEVDSEYEFNQGEKISVNYKFTNQFPEANQLLERFTLQSYNLVFKGNTLLQNEQFHAAALRYTKTSMYRGLMLNANASYNKKANTIRNVVVLNGINQFSTPVLTDNPETNWRVYGFINKKIKRVRLQFNSSLSWFNYIQTLNNVTTSNTRNNQSFSLKASTYYSKWPRMSIGYTKDFSQFSGLTTSNLTNDRISAEFGIDFLKHFNFKTDYEVTFNQNSTNQKTNYRIGNAYLSYQKKNKPFRFEITAENYLNNGLIVNNSFSDYLISNTRTFILPRVFLFSISYKL